MRTWVRVFVMIAAGAASGAPLVGQGVGREEPTSRSDVSIQSDVSTQGTAQQPPRSVGSTQEQPALIPREVLFGNPDRARALLSPDGKHLSYLAAGETGKVLNVWVAPSDKVDAAKVVTHDTRRGITRYWWAHTNAHVLYLQDQDGDENWHVYCTAIGTGATLDLTPFTEIPGPDGKPLVGRDGKAMRPSARLVALDASAPTAVLVAVNNRDPRLHDLYRVDITSGVSTRIADAPENTVDWVVDNSLALRFAVTFTDDGGQVWLTPRVGGAEKGTWDSAITLSAEDALTTGPVGFTADNKTMYVQDSRDRDTSALCTIDLATQTKKVVAQDHTSDLADVLVHPVTKRIQAASFSRLRIDWVVLDEGVREDFKTLSGIGRGDIEVVSRSNDDALWLVLLRADDGPSSYYLYHRDGKGGGGRADFLFNDRPALKAQPLARMTPTLIETRDGLEMVSYLTLPVNAAAAGGGATRPDKPLPMVLLVHGGPWARDEWGYNSLHQLLANRGYAVLSVNYRGSTGFGKTYINAAKGEWAGKMHDDLIDAVRWAIREKVADEDRVAIMGGSYGGYAALVGLTFTPDVFACGVSIVGPSNLVTLLESIPEYWKPGMAMWRTRVGDVSTPAGREFLKSRSPLTFVGAIQKPLLIGHGANDPRVKLEESNQIVEAMQGRSIPVTYVVFPDEGHGFQRPDNRIAFFGIAEGFLSKQLGGRCEPLGEAVKASTAEVRSGAEQVPGLPGTKGGSGAK